MNKYILLALLISCVPVVGAPVASRVIQSRLGAPIHITTTDLCEVLGHIEPGTLVVVELENVVMETETQLGSEQWADAIQPYFTPQGGTAKEGRANLTPLWNQILRQATMRPVNMSVQAFIRGLQRRGCPLMGLSAKDPDMAYVMLDHVRHVDLDLGRTAPFAGLLNVSGAATPAKSMFGVLFTGVYNDMGPVLAGFLNQVGMPRKVVMISNRYNHLKEVYEALNPCGILFVGVQLTWADKRASQFRADLAEVQLNFLGRVLSNEAASQLLPKSGWFW